MFSRHKHSLSGYACQVLCRELGDDKDGTGQSAYLGKCHKNFYEDIIHFFFFLWLHLSQGSNWSYTSITATHGIQATSVSYVAACVNARSETH